MRISFKATKIKDRASWVSSENPWPGSVDHTVLCLLTLPLSFPSASTWNYSVLGLSLATMILGLVLLTINIVRNR